LSSSHGSPACVHAGLNDGRAPMGYNRRTMATKPGGKRRSEYDVIEPIGERVVIRKDENKRETRTGIVLPDSHEIPVITGRVIAVSKQIENDDDQTIRQYDKVLFDPREAIPVELEHDNKMFVVHIDRVLAIFRRSDQVAKPKTDEAGGDGE
jgi:chaperonin GroES